MKDKELNIAILTLICIGVIMGMLIGIIITYKEWNNNPGWQQLYWAPNERVFDDQGVPLLGRVVKGNIEISREE